MRFKKNLNEYPTTNSIYKASDYLNEVLEKMIPRLKKISGLDVYVERSNVSAFSNYIKFDNEDYDTVFEIRISDHTNNELHTEDVDIRINERQWRDVKKEIINVVLEKYAI